MRVHREAVGCAVRGRELVLSRNRSQERREGRSRSRTLGGGRRGPERMALGGDGQGEENLVF